MKDLTKGPILTTLLRFAVPTFFGSLFQLFYSLTDTRIVGTYLGEQSLAAVGGSAILCNLMISFMNGMTIGFTVPMSRFYGAKNYNSLRKAFASAVCMGILICTTLVTIAQLFMDHLLEFMKMEDYLKADAKSYCTTLIFGMFFTFAYNLGASSLRALGNSLTPLFLLICSSFLNVGMDIYFISKLELGVFGAALATVLAQGISATLCLLYLWKKYSILHFKVQDMKLEAPIVKELLASGCSMAFMSSLVQTGTLMLQTAINGLGQNIVVAHTAARKITEIFMMAFGITGNAMCTFTGQNVGAGQYERVRKAIFGTMTFLACWVAVIILLANTVAGDMVYLITGSTNQEVQETASLYLRFDTAFYMVAASVTLLRNVLQGLGNHITPIVSSSVELVGKVVFAKLLVPHLGYWGVILAEPVVWIFMVIPLLIQILRNPYLRKTRERLA